MNIVNLPDYRLSMTTELLIFPLQNCHICDKLQFQHNFPYILAVS